MVIRFHVLGSARDARPVNGVLTLVDLAGSEKEADCPTPFGKEQARSINQSLTHLNRTLIKLQAGCLDESDKRQSALNMALYDSIKDDCGVQMLFCVHQDQTAYT